MPTNAKLIVSSCSTCYAHAVPCVRLGVMDFCRACDKSGNFVKLSTYRTKR